MLIGLAILLAFGVLLIIYSARCVKNGEKNWIPGIVFGGILVAVSVFLLTATLLLIWGID